MIPETRELYDAFRRAGGDRPRVAGAEPVPLGSTPLGLTLRRVPVEAAGTARLLEADRSIAENTHFEVPLFEPRCEPLRGPGGGVAHARLIVLLHGLNETLYNKLFPWAASLCARLNAPVALLPMALHVTRRPHDWLDLGRVLHPQREALADNASVSPFNAVLSARLEAEPSRFLRAGLATCDDLTALADAVHAGRWPGCAASARVDFVGYSAGGYTAASLLAGARGEHPALRASRLCLVASGADAAGIDVESLFILDRRGAHALRRALGEGDGPAFDGLDDPHGELDAFRALYAGHGSAFAKALGGRLAVITFAGDRVIAPQRTRENLVGTRVHELAAGLHEYPFTLTEALSAEYSPALGRRLLVALARAADVSEPLRGAFGVFIDALAAHLGE